MLRRRWWTQCAERFGVTYGGLRFTASATASADEVAAVLRKAFTIVSPDSNEVPLSRYVTAVDDLVKRSAAGVREAFATQGVLHHATQIRRVLRLDATNDTVSLDTNANAKHFRNFLRAMARVPDVGVSRQTLKDWLPSMTEGEFDTALKSSFAAWLRLQPGDLIVPVLPISGTDPVARAVMRALMAAPDGGLSLAAIRSAVMTATDTSPDVATVRSLLPVDWHVSMGPDAVSFCDWVSVMTRVHHRLPAEGVTLNNLIRYVQTEQHWPAAVVLHDVINANFLRTRFPDLFLVRTAASDGTSIIVVPRNAMDAERGTASSLLKLLLADPVDFGPPNVPYAHGWRNTESAFGAIEKIGIRPQTGGAADWVQLVREHAHFEAQIVVSIRLRAERCRAAVFVAVTESGLPVDTVDAILQKSGLLSNSNTVEASRVALRTASQPAHNSNDVVSPSWLETEFILAAQLTDLTQRVASGTSLPVDHVIVVCGAAQKDLLASVLRDVGTSFKKLTVVTPDGVHPVEQAAPSSE